MLSLAPSKRLSACRLAGAAALLAAAAAVPGATARAQAPTPPTQAPVERLGPTLVRIGNVRADTAKKEVSIAGTINEVQTLEFVAATKGGVKNYESAIQLDTNGINLNVALILIGLDPMRSTPPRGHLDPVPPKGDPVEVWVDWDGAQGHRHVRAEELIFNSQTKQTLTEGPWVYTGSVFSKEANQFMADVEGPLIGFVHTPAALIDSPRTLNQGAYGTNQFNPNLGLKVGDHVVVTIRALPR